MQSSSLTISDAPRLALYAVVAALVAYQTYQALPAWVKPSSRRERDAAEKDANDDLANPRAIIHKLSAMMKLCSDKVDDDLPWYKLYACFLSYVHLQRELQAAHPEHKDQRYEAATAAASHNGGGNKVDTKELQELREYCQFAKWAYLSSFLQLHEELRMAGYNLLRHDVATEPGRVGHFIGVNHKTKVAIISIKGTSSFSDALTDVLGNAIDYSLEKNDSSSSSPSVVTSKKIRVHEGMFTAANMICDDTQHLVENFFCPAGYTMVITGHSLGAGVACLLGLFLQSRIAAVNPTNLRVMAFATPACLDLTTAKAVAPFTTSVVNNTDCVPRLSVMNLVTLNKLFVKVDEKLQEHGRSPSSWKASKAYFSDLMKIDDDLLMSPEELQAAELEIVERLRQEHADHSLFVPGRVVLMWESSSSPSGDDDDGTRRQNVRAGNGGSNVLRHIEVETTMVSDHACSRYLENLTTLLEQRKSNEEP